VKEVWGSLQAKRDEGVQVRLVWKLKTLKSHVNTWSKERRVQEKFALETIEDNLASLLIWKAQSVDI
jgi:hypothetical protein